MPKTSYLTSIIPQDKHTIPSRVYNHTKLPITGIDIVLERIAGFPRQNILGGDMLTKPVENVDFLCFRRIDFVLAG